MSNIEKARATDQAVASVVARSVLAEASKASGVYRVECRDKDGNLKWVEDFHNLVTTVGKNDALDKHLGGSAYTAAWYLGLVNNTPTYAAADTMASHAGWTESTAYSEAARPTASFGAASAGSKATSATTFTMNGTATIAGVFLTSNSTKGGTTGILYSAGSFSAARSVVANDTLSVTYTATLT